MKPKWVPFCRRCDQARGLTTGLWVKHGKLGQLMPKKRCVRCLKRTSGRAPKSEVQP